MTAAAVFKPKGATAVMAERHDPTDALSFFPTPPWATRALCEHVLHRPSLKHFTAWDPAAGEGHMSEVLREYFDDVFASDVHDYGRGYALGSFVGEGADRIAWPHRKPPHWAIFNPPFPLGLEFVLRALDEVQVGVAVLLRSVWMEGRERHERLFSKRPPTTIAFFSERVPMHKGRWEPTGSTATSYAWFVWQIGIDTPTRAILIPPGRRKALEHPDDRRRFAAQPKQEL